MEEVEVKQEPDLELKIEPQSELELIYPIGPDDQCDNNPEFAVICSFIKQFGDRIDLELNIEQLKEGIENLDSLDDNLIEIHVKLLKKLRRYFVRDQWEKALIRYAYEYSYEHGRELEIQGYLKTRPTVRLQLLRRLLDAQFECDQKFKSIVNTDESDGLRNRPVGRDIRGNIYWHCEDKDGNLRVYSEDPMNYKSWKLLCKNPTELDNLITELDKIKDDKIKGEPYTDPYNPYPEIFPEYFVKSDEDLAENQDELKVSNKKLGKKNRRGRPAKKSSPIQPAQPEANDIKPDVAIQEERQENIDATTPPSSLRAATPLKDEQTSQTNSSIESQVKQTLDNIINKVATSFDFFFRRNNADSAKKSEPEVAKKPRKRNSRKEKVIQQELPRRTSSRIQQLQQRKITEYVEKQTSEQKENDNVSKPSKPIKEELKPSIICSKPKKGAKRDKQRWRMKGKKKLSWDKDDSDLSSISSPTDSNDESFAEELNGVLESETVHESDEFACEDEETNDAPVIVKRARTARQIVDNEEDGQPNNISITEEDKPCGKCDKSNDPDCILLCDMCDDGYHTACCIPPLMFVPDGDWFCLPCEHKTLLSKLQSIATSIKSLLAEKERERLKRQKLRQAFRKTSSKPNDELVPEKRNRAKLPDLNPPNAVQELDEILGESSGQELSDSYRERAYKQTRRKKRTNARPARNRRRRRDISDDEDEEIYSVNRSSRRTYSRREKLSETESEADEGSDSSSDVSDDGSQLKTRKARACVSYRFQEYDELIKSAIQADSDDPVSAVEDQPAQEISNYGRGKDMATIEAIAYQQENGLDDPELRVAPADNGASSPIKEVRSRKKGRRLNDLDAESEVDQATSDDSFQAASETEEEEEEEDSITEIDSEDDSSIDEIVHVRTPKSRGSKRKRRKRDSYESDESDDWEPRSRRSATKRVSYKESSDEDEEELLAKPSKQRKKEYSDDDTEASWQSSNKSPADAGPLDDDAPTDVEENLPAGDDGSLSSPIATQEEVNFGMEHDEPPTDITEAEPEVPRAPAGSKKIRLEKRETRPVFTANVLNESVDEIAEPLYQPKIKARVSKSKQKPVMMSAPDVPSNPIPNQAQAANNAQTSSTSDQLPKLLDRSAIPPVGSQVTPSAALISSIPSQPVIGPYSHPYPHSGIHPHHPPPPQYPPYSQSPYSSHQQYPRPQYYMPHMYPQGPSNFAPPPMPYMMRPMPPSTGLPPRNPIRNPIDELNQYCNRSPYPANIFNSFNVSHPPKNVPAPHPPFYREDEVRPPPSATNNNKQKSW